MIATTSRPVLISWSLRLRGEFGFGFVYNGMIPFDPEELWHGLEQIVIGWARCLETSGREPEGHAYRVAELTLRLGRRCGVFGPELHHAILGALLHDIGKFALPEAILNKPGKLEPTERALVEQHPTLARQMMMPIEMLRPAIDIPFCHHERWDGRGYPRGIEGEEIPFVSRLFSVVDVYDVLTHESPYRPAWEHERALEQIEASAGGQFDPEVVREFLVLASNPEHVVVDVQEQKSLLMLA